MKKTAPLLLLCSLCCGIAAAQSQYSLAQLKDSALHNNIAIRNARLSIEAAQQQRKEAFTKYFPNISGTGLWFNANRDMAKMDIDPSGMISSQQAVALSQLFPPEALAALANPISISMMKNGTIGSLIALQPVFAGGQIINGNKLAKVGEDVSQLQLQLSENEVEKTTEQYYWQLVSLQEKIKTINAVDTLLADIYKDVEVAVRAGVALRNDLLQVQLRQNDIASQRLKLQNGISIVRLLLSQYCGLRDTSFVLAPAPAALSAPTVSSSASSVLPSHQGEGLGVGSVTSPAAQVPSAAFSALPSHQGEGLGEGSVTSPAAPPVPAASPVLALAPVPAGSPAGLPEYRLLEKQVEATALQRKLAIGENLPTVAVGAGYTYHNLLDNDHTFAMLFATVTVPISDWWGGSHAVKRRKIEHQQAIEQLEDNAQLLQIRMQNAWNSVEESCQQLLLAQRSIEQAKENLRLNRDYYRAGTSKMSDLLEAQLLYQQALDRHTDAFADYHNKLLEYKQATGQ